MASGGRVTWRYAPRMIAHAVARRLAGGRLRLHCLREGPACARDFRSAGYAHAVRGRDLPACCRARLLEVLGAVHGALAEAGIAHFAWWGTFLGAVRHGDVIPWDTDADLVVGQADRARAETALARLAASRGYALRPRYGGNAAVLHVQVSPANRIGVDVEFWTSQGGELVFRDAAGLHRLPARVHGTLARWAFGPLVLPAPADAAALHALYGPDCLVRGLRREQRFGSAVVDLRHLVPARPLGPVEPGSLPLRAPSPQNEKASEATAAWVQAKV